VRLLEILDWLAINRVKCGVEQWVALDDLPLHRACSEICEQSAQHLVRTNPAAGLQDADVSNALRILSGELRVRPSKSLSPAQTQKTIVLDIDGTLIDTLHRSELLDIFGPGVAPFAAEDADGDCIFPRPHLSAFLDFLFSRFAAVAIWTAASRGWADFVVRDALGAHRPWAFVWSGERCVSKNVYGSFGFEKCSVKPLRKVWSTPARRALGFSRQQTIILEDTPKGCARNYSNAIFVPTFDVSRSWNRELGSAQDTTFESLIPFFETVILPIADVRDRQGGGFGWREPQSEDDETDEACPVCRGTGRLLDDLCPLCGS